MLGLGEITLPIPFAGVLIAVWAASAWITLRTLKTRQVTAEEVRKALAEATKTIDQQELDDIRGLVDETNHLVTETKGWLNVADQTNAIKAIFYGLFGVLLGVIGGLSADWVAHGKWASGEWRRALCVGGGLIIAAIVIFVLVWKGGDRILNWRNQR